MLKTKQKENWTVTVQEQLVKTKSVKQLTKTLESFI